MLRSASLLLFGLSSPARACASMVSTRALVTRASGTPAARAPRVDSTAMPDHPGDKTTVAKRKRKRRDEVPPPSTPLPASARQAKTPLLLNPPDGWRPTYDLITKLRADRTAVVDRMGSEATTALHGDDGLSKWTVGDLLHRSIHVAPDQALQGQPARRAASSLWK
jgi:hypothetical protein